MIKGSKFSMALIAVFKVSKMASVSTCKKNLIRRKYRGC
jgi:hypothetical protein